MRRVENRLPKLSNEELMELACVSYFDADIDFNFFVKYSMMHTFSTLRIEDITELGNIIYFLDKSLDAVQNDTEYVDKTYTWEELVDLHYLLTTF